MIKTANKKKKNSYDSALQGRYPDSVLARAQRWDEKFASPSNPVAARHDIEGFEAVSARPANDDGKRSRSQRRISPHFLGSRYFWAAAVGTIVFSVLFAGLMGFRTGTAFTALLRDPVQYTPFLLSIAAIAVIQWLIAMSAHRQAVNHEMWRRMMAVTQRINDPSPIAEEAGRKLNASFERLFSDLDARMLALDEKTTALATQISNVMQQSSASADVNMEQMRNIVEATEQQREALQRSGVMMSTEIMPVITKLETTVQSLETVSKSAGTVLSSVSGQLQQSAKAVQACLENFNRVNVTAVPEIEKRLAKFEAALTRLPGQIEATLTRLAPLTDTIADAAMLSTANIEVIEQLGRDITDSLQKSRSLFVDFASSNKELFNRAVESHVQQFRDMLGTSIEEETARLAGLTRELGFLAETAQSMVTKLQQPVAKVTETANKSLEDMNGSINRLEQRMQENLEQSIKHLNDAASGVVSNVSREIEAATIALQTRLSASSSDLVQRVNSDATRFEGLISEVADKTSNRLTSAIKEIPAALTQRLESEVAKIDGSLKGSVVGLSDQMRSIIDGIPSRLNSMTRETLQALETNLERSFDGVARRSERLNEQFKKNATETTEAVLENYVDFIFLAIERFRSEMEALNSNFSKEIEVTLQPLAVKTEGRGSIAATEQTSYAKISKLSKAREHSSPGAA